MNLQITSGSLGLPCYIILIYNSMAHSSDVDDMTHYTTWHESASMLMLLLVCMSSCSAAEWWMSYWCITTLPLHGKVCGVFDGHWCSLGVACACCSFSYTLGCLTCSSFRERFSSFVYKHISLHALLIRSFVNTYPCMCPYCSSRPLSRHVLLMYLYHQSLMMRRHQIHKPPSPPWCILIHV